MQICSRSKGAMMHFALRITYTRCERHVCRGMTASRLLRFTIYYYIRKLHRNFISINSVMAGCLLTPNALTSEALVSNLILICPLSPFRIYGYKSSGLLERRWNSRTRCTIQTDRLVPIQTILKDCCEFYSYRE